MWDVDGNEYIDWVSLVGAADPRPRQPDGGRRDRRGRGDGTTFGAPTERRGDARRRGGGSGPVGRDGADDLVGDRGDDERDPARPRGHRPRAGAEVRRRVPRPRRRPAGPGRLGARHAGDPGEPGRAGGGRGGDRDRALERPRGGPRSHRRARARGDPRRAGAGQHGRGAAGAGVPRVAARARRRQRGAADLRRGDHRLPRGARRRPGALRRDCRT